MRELFIEELEEVQGGIFDKPCKCCRPTTQACCEECNNCCDRV